MELLDPRMAIIAGVGGAVLSSHQVRTVLGKGAGYTAKGVMAVAGPVVRPMVHAGEDIVAEARQTATSNGERYERRDESPGAAARPARPRTKAAS